MSISARAYLCTTWHIHSPLADLISDYRAAFPIIFIGNQNAEYICGAAMAVRALEVTQICMFGGALADSESRAGETAS